MLERVSIHIENHIADVRLNRPEKMNALDSQLFRDIISAQEQLAADPSVRVVVLSGEGKSFCAGIDLGFLTSSTDKEFSPLSQDLNARVYGNSNLFQEVAIGWRKLPMPVVCAIHGVCFGGGLQVASGADIRIASKSARISVMEMKWGLLPDMAGFALWRGNVRDDVLREMTYSNREILGEEAKQLGFVTHVDDEPCQRAMNIAKEIASKNPQAIRSAKELFNRLPDINEDEILMMESELQTKVICHPNLDEAIGASLERRAPKFVDQ